MLMLVTDCPDHGTRKTRWKQQASVGKEAVDAELGCDENAMMAAQDDFVSDPGNLNEQVSVAKAAVDAELHLRRQF